MRSRIYLGAALAAVAAFGGFPDSGRDGSPGISSAEAKDYYTKKRVNGRWISGRFPKRTFAVKRSPKLVIAARSSPRPAAEPVSSRPTRAEAPTRPVLAATPSRAAPAAAAPPEPLAPPPSDERMLRLRAALQAHARTIATGSLGPPPAEELRAGLPPGPVSRAVVPAAVMTPAGAEPPAAPAPQPAAIAYDLTTGLKRTTFTDGSVVEEEFDVEAVKGQMAASGKDARTPGLSP